MNDGNDKNDDEMNENDLDDGIVNESDSSDTEPVSKKEKL